MLLKNNFKLSARNLIKTPGISLIKIIGLSLALSVFMLISKFVYNELNYDKFHSNYSRIFRLCSKIPGNNNEIMRYPISMGALANKLSLTTPEIKYGTSFFKINEKNVVIDNSTLLIKDVLYVDNNFFNVFNFKPNTANIEKILDQPNRAILTKDMAIKLLGSTDVINKTIFIDNKNYVVGAICENVPKLSHFRFNILLSLNSINGSDNNFINQQGLSFYNYIKLDQELNNNIEEKIVKNSEGILSQFLNNIGFEDIHASIDLQSISEIHLNSNMLHELRKNGNKKLIYINLILIFVILIAASINYSSIFMIKAQYRGKEIAMRKIMGASITKVRTLLVFESLFISLITALLAIIISFFIAPILETLLNTPIGWDFRSAIIQLPFLILFSGLVGLISGLYPAIKLSAVNPFRLLQNHSSKSRNSLTRIFVIFQLTLSAIILINLIMTNSQINLMKNKDLGYQTENIIIVDGLTKNILQHKELLTEKIKAKNWVTNISFSQHIPGFDLSVQKVKNKEGKEGILVQEIRSDENFIDVLSLPIKTGQLDFLKLLRNHNNVLINEEAKKQLGLENPLGEKLNMIYTEKNIVGVLKNFNFESLHNSINPLIIHGGSMQARFLIIRSNQILSKNILTNLKNEIQHIDRSFAGKISQYKDLLNSLYKSEERTLGIYIFSVIIILVLSLMGILALTSISILNKSKSIAIRKTFGASSEKILIMLSKQFLYNLLIAFCIASPISYHLMHKWLLNFPYRNEITIQPFVYSFIILLGLVYIVTGFYLIKAARNNPNKVLRYL